LIIKKKERKETKIKVVYNLLMKRRVVNKRTNLGKIYFEKTYINETIIANANTT